MPQHPRDPRTPVFLIAGLARNAAAELAAGLRKTPGTAVIHHDLRRGLGGAVHRRIQARDPDDRESYEYVPLELVGDCLSCTLREDLLGQLDAMAQRPEITRIVVWLDEAIEPEPVCCAIHQVLIEERALSDRVRIDGVLTVVEMDHWLDDATGDATLGDRELAVGAGDERTLAQVITTQAEFADVLVHSGQAPDHWLATRTAAVLERLAPSAPRIDLRETGAEAAVGAIREDARRGEPIDPHGSLLRGQPPLETDAGVATVVFTDSRPFHPQRLHEAIDVLLDGVVRSRGRAWLASQPDEVLWLESAGGGLGVGHAGRWLAASDGPTWDAVSPERRALASLRWDPRFGDRAQELVVISHRASPREIEDALSQALLHDHEIAEGPQGWATYPDPFGAWHTEPCAETDVPDGRSGSHTENPGTD